MSYSVETKGEVKDFGLAFENVPLDLNLHVVLTICEEGDAIEFLQDESYYE